MSSARLLMRMAFICSQCETALRLRPSEAIPKSCPYCGAEFDNSNDGNIVNGSEESVTKLKTPGSSNG